jgi:hypothetical protein
MNPANRLQFRKQKTTMQRMDALCTALEEVRMACGGYPVRETEPLGISCDEPGSFLQTIESYSTREALLPCDGWSRSIEFVNVTQLGVPLMPLSAIQPECLDEFGRQWADEYVLFSSGRDGM